jgi:phosphinothricin acetyltransferase
MTENLILARPAQLMDLPRIVEIQNHYIEHTHINFDVLPFTTEQRIPWFHEHNSGGRYRLLVAEDERDGVVGFATTGRFRPKKAYETTVEVSIACSADATGKGIGTRLYTELFRILQGEDIHRVVAGIAQPNAASNALHEHFGFRLVGTFSEVGRKFGRYWDVRWMEKLMTHP